MANVNNITRNFILGALQGYVTKIAPITAFSYATTTAGTINDTVTVPYVVCNTSSLSYSKGGAYTVQNNVAVTGKQVTLSTVSYQPISLDDADLAKLSQPVLERLGASAGEMLANDVISASFAANVGSFPYSSSYTAGQFTGSTVTPFAALDKTCNDLKWPDTGRVILMNSTLKQNISLNTAFSNASAFGASVAPTGQFQQIFGFKPYVVTTTLGGKSGFVATPNSMLFAFGVHNPPANNTLTEFETVTDPASGLTLSMKAWYDPAYARTVRIIECLWGAGVGDSNAGLTIA